MQAPYASFLTSALIVCTSLSGAWSGETDVSKIPESEYVRANNDGHLMLRGKRIRFWGAIGSFPGRQQTIDGDPYAAQRRIVQRLKDTGFNMIRCWRFAGNYKKGDASKGDIIDFLLSECKRNDIYIWAAGMASGKLFEDQIEKAVKVIDDPATEEEWKAGVAKMMKKHYWSRGKRALSLKTVAVAWDKRLEALAVQQMKRHADHVNLHTGLRYGDDPQMAIWELSNEQWWTRRMTGGQWKKLPVYFKRSLLKKWHAFLKQKYGDEKAIRMAWGFLLDGESLEKETVLFAPMCRATEAVQLNDTNPHAIAAFKTVKSKYGRDDFTFQRGADVMEFLTKTIVDHKKRWAAKVKTWGRSCKLSPLIYDTGIGYNAQSQYLHQQADAVAHDAYMEGIELHRADPHHKRYPFYSILDQAPRICKDVPWLEHNKIEGKPYLCYETQLGAPTPYRAEFPMRIAALASIQDWDAICWHYWAVSSYDFTKERPFDGPIAKPGPGAFQYHYTFDEVEFSALRAASAIFRNECLKPAPSPTKFTYGRKALYNPANMDYAGSYGRTGWNMLDTTYRHGVRIRIDPDQKEFVKVEGKQIRFNGFEKPCPIVPTNEIEFDYQKAHQIFDSPSVASYTGFLAQYGKDEVTFRNGVVLKDVTHNNPPNSAYPMSQDERYLEFSLVSEDGKPLSETRRAVLSLVSCSFNAGLKIATKKGEKTNYGAMPVHVTRVGGTVKSSAIDGMSYVMRDFHMKAIAEGKVTSGTLKVPDDQPVFVIELTR